MQGNLSGLHDVGKVDTGIQGENMRSDIFMCNVGGAENTP